MTPDVLNAVIQYVIAPLAAGKAGAVQQQQGSGTKVYVVQTEEVSEAS